MAEVWMGRRQAMGGASKAVAIKLLAQHLATKPVYRRMFVDEARLTMMLTHSNIVQVFDVGEHGGRSYLVMEWIDGLDLSRLAAELRERGQAVPIHLAAHVIGEVLRGLAYAHGLTEGETSSTIVHRDISPHTVLISVSGEVKVSDFGVARLASEETSGLHVRGKLRYMPPEQVRGQSKHAGIDLFAVGAMLQELLDGVRFRAGLERDELFAMVIEGEVPPLERRGVPPALRALRDGLLAAKREDRLPSAEAALELLRSWPGYRNATDELAEFVRGCSGVSAPRTGLTVEVSDDQLEVSDDVACDDEPTVVEGSGSDAASELATRTIKQAESAGSETTPAPQLREGTGSMVVRRAWPVALGAALLCLGVGLGFGYSWLAGAGPGAVGEAEPGTAVEASEGLDNEAASGRGHVLASAHASVAAAPPSAVGAEPELEAELELEAEPELESEPKPEAEASASPKPSAAKAPAKVEFAAHEFFFVWIKVAGKQRALEPLASVELPPGSHKVWLRERKDQPWRSAGRIKVSSGHSYRVKLAKPAKVQLSKL